MDSKKNQQQRPGPENVAAALGLLQAHAHDLFPQEADAAQFLALLQRCSEQSGPLSGATSEAEALDLASLAELVHAVSRIEDTLSEVQHAADVVADWVAKGGRSLGLD